VPNLAQGSYYRAENPDQLPEVIVSPPGKIPPQKQVAELTVAFLNAVRCSC